MTDIIPTADGLGYYVVVGDRKAFCSSMHLTADKEAQLQRLNQEDRKP